MQRSEAASLSRVTEQRVRSGAWEAFFHLAPPHRNPCPRRSAQNAENSQWTMINVFPS
jgi:hypothetical protein